MAPGVNTSSTPTLNLPPFLNGTAATCPANKQQTSSEYIFFLNLTLVVLALRASLTALKDWPGTRLWLCADFEPDEDVVRLMTELKRSYSWAAIGGSLILYVGLLLE